MRRTTSLLIAVLLGILCIVSTGFSATIRPSKPTHLYYTPTSYLNDEYDLVVSLHEISYTLPHSLQIHMSLVDNIGRNCLGARYALTDNMLVGGGIAYSLASLGDGGHGIKHHDDPRFGIFLTYGFIQSQQADGAVTPHVQLGKHISMGADLGFRKTINDVVSLIGEVGTSMDLSDVEFYLNLDGGLRIHPPKIPFLSFDLGVDFCESRIEDFTHVVIPFIDIIYTMKTN